MQRAYMSNGYKIFWTDEALSNLEDILEYLKTRWTTKELKKFSKKLEKQLELIKKNPQIFPLSKKRSNIRRSVLTRQVTLYYEIDEKKISIVTLFDTRQDTDKLKI